MHCLNSPKFATADWLATLSNEESWRSSDFQLAQYSAVAAEDELKMQVRNIGGNNSFQLAADRRHETKAITTCYTYFVVRFSSPPEVPLCPTLIGTVDPGQPQPD